MTFEWFLFAGGVIVVATFAGAALLSNSVERATAAIAGSCVLLGIHAFALLRYRFDDSFITYRYARNLADGHGPVWNPGERVEGYTSFLWMLLLAAANLIGLDIEVAAVLFACLSMVALFVVMWRVALHLHEDTDVPFPTEIVVAGAALLVAANSAIGTWSMSGLETPLAAALIMAVVLTYQRESRAPGVPMSAFVLAAGVMTRPEMTFVTLVTGAFFLAQAVMERDARRWRHFAFFVLIFGVLAGTWFAWRWAYYGYFFPNTYYVKVGPMSLMIDRGWAYLDLYWHDNLLIYALIASVILPVRLRGAARRDAAFVAALSIVWLGAVVLEGGDVFPYGRFVVPIIAPLYTVMLTTMLLAIAHIPVGRLYKTAAVAAAVIGAALFVTQSSNREPEAELNRRVLSEFEVLGLWIRENAPPDYVTAVFAAGVIPYYSQRPSIDMLGLTDEVIAHTDVPDFGHGYAGHEKYNLDYALDERRPELIMVGGASFDGPITEAEVRETVGDGPGLAPAFNKLVQDERTWQRYEMAAFFFRDRWFNFLVRKDIEGNLNVGWIESKGFINGGQGRPR